MEPLNAKRLHVLKLCKKYRPNEELDGVCQTPVNKLHEQLQLEKFDDNQPLGEMNISQIVHYCYYRGNAGTIGRIMAKPRLMS
jgi:hypothetical protein